MSSAGMIRYFHSASLQTEFFSTYLCICLYCIYIYIYIFFSIIITRTTTEIKQLTPSPPSMNQPDAIRNQIPLLTLTIQTVMKKKKKIKIIAHVIVKPRIHPSLRSESKSDTFSKPSENNRQNYNLFRCKWKSPASQRTRLTTPKKKKK